MPSNTKVRKYIRHPSDVPIQVTLNLVEDDSEETADETLTNVSLGGLSFISKQPFEIEQKVRVSIPLLKQDTNLLGTVVWCEKTTESYEIGIQFEGSKDLFRLRMIEQICHIEHYRKEIKLVEGRELSTAQAATEWISRYASDFPPIKS
ncbi:MAG: PilZ domain-containing protein [Gammaproteobacteria bacterium]